MNVKYTSDIDIIKGYSFNGFCKDWKKSLSKNKLIKLCSNSNYFIAAIAEKQNKIIGIITALSDNINWVFIQYLEVLAEYQNNGIGSKLLIKILKKYKGISCIDLTCNENVQSFYERFGMKKSHGMVLRKF